MIEWVGARDCRGWKETDLTVCVKHKHKRIFQNLKIKNNNFKVKINCLWHVSYIWTLNLINCFKEKIVNEVEKSLKRLKLDYLDLVLHHSPAPRLNFLPDFLQNISQIFAFMKMLKLLKLILIPGLSFYLHCWILILFPVCLILKMKLGWINVDFKPG